MLSARRALLAGLVTLPLPAFAQALSRITVIAPSPVPGADVPAAIVPTQVDTLTAADIDRTLVPDLTGELLANIPGATVNETSGSTFQPDILYHGFIASPVAGTAQGLAVYVDGTRFNDPFGDTVNWDLIAPEAIKSVAVQATNPIFGLNALGGAIDVRLKDAFSAEGGDITAYGGSYDRGAGSIEYATHNDHLGFYAAADTANDGGWRQTQQAALYRLYTDLGWRDAVSELHLSITAADNKLGNPGASPVQELDVAPSGIFSGPNTVTNEYVSARLRGTTRLNAATALQAVAYFDNLTQRVSNGATVDAEPCDNGTGALCNGDGTPVTTFGGAIVPDFLHGGPYSALVLEGLDAKSYGASLQLTEAAPVFSRPNHFVIGGSFDGSNSTFNADTTIGGFTSNGTQLFVGPPDYIQVQPSEGVTPVKLGTVTRYFGLFFTDTLTVLPSLDLTLAGRFNAAQIDLHDEIGTALNGNHVYNRFNPDAGLAWHVLPSTTLFVNYAEANRAPTPTELSCSNANNPCSLLNFFIGDPNLKQVIARTVEVGARGTLPPQFGGHLHWSVDYYHTADTDDLIFESALNNPNLAYYTNAGRTLRQGVEAALDFDTGRLHLALGYAYTDATFQSSLLLGSQENPGADANGNIQVRPGDQLPGIPQHRGTIVASYKLTNAWTIGTDADLQSSQYFYGDEANLQKPLGGYVVVNVNTQYRVTDRLTLFALVDNIFDQRYANYGTFGPTDAVPFRMVPGGVTSTRTADPGQPVSAYGGLRYRF